MSVKISSSPSSNPSVVTLNSIYSLKAKLNYMTPMAERPYTYTYSPEEGITANNVVYESHTVSIENGRSRLGELSLDQQGFTLLSHHSQVNNFYDETEIRAVYYPEAQQLVKEAIGAAKVLVFDHNLRNALQVSQGIKGIREPVKRVHNDFTAMSGYRRSRDELAAIGIDNPEQLLQHRFGIVNVWRPIDHPVQESPLALCDARSIAPTDWVASDLIYRDRVGETYLTTYNSAHRWFYFPDMQPDEALLIKCFDSAENNPARFTAHTAFDDPTSLPDAQPRASIELRTLVFYDE